MWLWSSISAIPGRGTEVAVDLEGRVGVEQVGVGASPSVYCVSAPPTSFICRRIMRCAWSPSCARARTLIFQLTDQPVPYGIHVCCDPEFEFLHIEFMNQTKQIMNTVFDRDSQMYGN